MDTELETLRVKNKIHPSAIIGPDVKMGVNNIISAGVIIEGPVEIGSYNHIFPYAVIGTAPEHKSWWIRPDFKSVIIRNGCVIREFTTINAGTVGNTILNNNVIMLRGSHVGHDAVIGHDVTLSCNVLIGGHTVIGDYVNCGLGAIIHQNLLIPQGVMLGMGAIVTKKLKMDPYSTYAGNPARLIGLNEKHPNYTIYMRDSL